MRKRAFIAVVALTAVAVAGLLSNLASKRAVEHAITALNHQSIVAVDRLWRISPRKVRAVESSALAYRSDTIEGKKVRYQLPPSAPLPFEYAHASSFVPFILKVRYGWADGGTRMAFGEGGEYIVASFFGARPIVLRKTPHWYF